MKRFLPRPVRAFALAFSTVLATGLFLGGAGAGSGALAHEAKLYLDQTGTVGQPTEIRFAWGHFPDQVDTNSAFFKGVGEGELVALGPDGVVYPLDFRLNNENFYVARFTPPAEGTYWIIHSKTRGVEDRTRRNPPEGMRLRFYGTKAPLVVGNAPRVRIERTFLPAEFVSDDPLPRRVGDSLTFRVDYRGGAVAHQLVDATGPSLTWQNLEADASGQIRLTFNEPGTWLVKAHTFDRERSGQFGENEYDNVRLSSTMYLQIAE